MAQPLGENKHLSFLGVSPEGPFAIPGALARIWLTEKNNPNNRPNSDVLRRYFSGIDINKRPRDNWMVDFGSGLSEEQASLYVKPFEYVKKNVKPFRENSRGPGRRPWWEFARSKPAMREALVGLNRYIGTSMMSRHRIFSWLPARVLPAKRIIIIARSDDYIFGVLHSKPHALWASRQGTSLEDRPRYTRTTTFETFPFPWSPGYEPKDDPRVKAVADAAKALAGRRAAWLNPPLADEYELRRRTLTNLYNRRPTWLDWAHRKLDQAVLDAYGWPHDLSHEEILERLLELNLERAENSA